MTIEVKREVTISAYDSAIWPLFDKQRGLGLFDVLPEVGIVSYSISKLVHRNSDDELLNVCFKSLASDLKILSQPGFKTWLFMVELLSKSNTKLNVYKSLWRTLHSKTKEILTPGTEMMFQDGDNIRYAGLATVEERFLRQAIGMSGLVNALIISERDIDNVAGVKTIYSQAQPNKISIGVEPIDWMTLASSVCPLGDILIRSGIQDSDKTAYIDLFASTKSIMKISK